MKGGRELEGGKQTLEAEAQCSTRDSSKAFHLGNADLSRSHDWSEARLGF